MEKEQSLSDLIKTNDIETANAVEAKDVSTVVGDVVNAADVANVVKGDVIQDNHVSTVGDTGAINPADDLKSDVVPEANDIVAEATESKEVPGTEVHDAGPLRGLKMFAEQREAEVEEKLEEKEYEKINENAVQDLLGNKTEFKDDIIIEDNSEEESEDIKSNLPEIDLTSIKIKRAKDPTKAYQKIKKKREKMEVVTQVVFPNSGYLAQYKGFSSTELRKLPSILSNLDKFRALQYKLKVIHDKMVTTNVGRMSFENWLKTTSVLEINNIYYALFCSTYPDVNSYPHICEDPKCKAKFTFDYHNKNLLMLDGEEENIDETRDTIVHIINDIERAMELYSESNVNTLDRVRLPESGIIVEVRHPSLWNELKDTLQPAIVGEIDDDEAIATLTYIENIYVPEDPSDPETDFLMLEDINDKYDAITNLKEKDDLALAKTLNKIVSKYNIVYGMHDVVCPFCKKVQKKIIIDNLESFLFTVHQIKLNATE